MEPTCTWWTMRTRRTSSGCMCSSKTSTFKFISPLQNWRHRDVDTSLTRGDITVFLFPVCSKYDLYSKSNVRIDVEEVKPYYMSLIKKVKHICVDLYRSTSSVVQFTLNFLSINVCGDIFWISDAIFVSERLAAVLPREAEMVKRAPWRGTKESFQGSLYPRSAYVVQRVMYEHFHTQAKSSVPILYPADQTELPWAIQFRIKIAASRAI